VREVAPALEIEELARTRAGRTTADDGCAETDTCVETDIGAALLVTVSA
jgi:hypothetical protein